MKIDINKKYQTRDGHPVRILCVDAKGDYPIIGLVLSAGSKEVAESWTHDGFRNLGPGYHLDLVEVIEPRTVWVNIYEEPKFVSMFLTRGMADKFADNRIRVACVAITYRPGDGLEKAVRHD